MILALDYKKAKDLSLRLANPLVDARLISQSLRRAGVKAITVLEDPSIDVWIEEFESYVGGLESNDIALVYYAGHAVQIRGENYLLASDGKTLFSLSSLLASLLDSRARATIIVLDACRNNPFDSEVEGVDLQIRSVHGRAVQYEAIELSKVASGARGLAQLSSVSGLSAVVFFSTEPGNVALDGSEPGKGSPFARIFSQELRKRQSIDQLFKRTAINVNAITSGKQSPWRQGDLSLDVYVAGKRRPPPP